MQYISFEKLGTFTSVPNQSEYNKRYSTYSIQFKQNKNGDVIKFHISRQIVAMLNLSEIDRRIQIHPYKDGLVLYKTNEGGFLVSLLGYGAINQKQLANEVYEYMDYTDEVSMDAVEEVTVTHGKKKYHAVYIHN